VSYISMRNKPHIKLRLFYWQGAITLRCACCISFDRAWCVAEVRAMSSTFGCRTALKAANGKF
jgi:hypothetical protein